MSELCATGEWGWCNVCPTEVHSVWARGPTSSACLHPSALQSALQSGTSADVREDCWMTNEQTYIDLDTHTHTRSRKKTNRHIVHSYSYGHTHTHSILLLFTLFLLYIHVTHMKLRHTSMHFKRNAIFFSLQVFLSQPIQHTYTHLKYTLAVWPAWMSQYIYHCNPFWSSSHQCALTDVDDLFPDDTNIKVWFIKSLHSGTD